MTTLSELASSADGAALLEGEGVFLDRGSFLKALRHPASDVLARLAGSPESGEGGAHQLVYVGHQLCVDYGSSVVAKLAVLAELQSDHDLPACAVWVDTDRAGSDKRMTVISWPRRTGRAGITFAPPGSKEREPRFIRIEPPQVVKALDRLRSYLGESGVGPAGLDRYERLREALLQMRPGTLADLGARITDLTLAERDIRLAPVRMSGLLRESDLAEQVHAALNVLPRVIEVFNRAVSDLGQEGVDPLLRPLPDDYLPLRVSCMSDGTRLPLRLSNRAGEAYAVATCRCGADYRFRLGRGELSLEQLAASQRWSPDVLLPAFLNEMASGVVAGKSSAIYGMVLNRVIRQALGKEPIPMLVPESLVSRAQEGPPLLADSLVVDHLLRG